MLSRQLPRRVKIALIVGFIVAIAVGSIVGFIMGFMLDEAIVEGRITSGGIIRCGTIGCRFIGGGIGGIVAGISGIKGMCLGSRVALDMLEHRESEGT